MKPCDYRFDVETEGRFGCSNRVDLLHSGTVPESICHVCLYAKVFPRKTLDFFTATAQLLNDRRRKGLDRPKSKPCDGCSEVKRRNLQQPVQFVWPYWHGGANGDEIRWSMRSVETFFQGEATCTIVGDRPPWYHGHVIRKKRVSKTRANRRYRDMLSKVWFMATHSEMQSDFIWMMDDIYFIKPVTLEDLKTPRAAAWRPSESNSWQRRKTNTMAALKAIGRTTHDYATHMPHWVEKEKLRAVFDAMNMHDNTLLWEVVYGNMCRETPQNLRPFFRRITTAMPLAAIRAATSHASVLNHGANCWSASMHQFLSELLPTPAASENATNLKATAFRTTRKTPQTVKRRPPETHRAYLEAQQ